MSGSHVVAVGLPILALLLLVRLEGLAAPPLWVLLGSLLWGSTAYFISSAAELALGLTVITTEGWLGSIVVPLIQELAKALFVFVLVRLRVLSAPVPGTTAGFAVGTAFGITDTIVVLQAGGGFELALTHALSITLMHASSTGLIGLFLTRPRVPAASAVRVRGAALVVSIATSILRVAFIRFIAIRGMRTEAAATSKAVVQHASFNDLLQHPWDFALLILALTFAVSMVAYTAISMRRSHAMHKQLTG